MNVADPYQITCPACHLPMVRAEAVREGERIALDHYKCPDTACARNVAVVFEPTGGFDEEEKTFVEREIARRGAFFPSDYRPGGSRWRT